MSVVITGAAGALGSEVARVLSARGNKVLLVDRPEASARLVEVAKSVNGFAAPADITSPHAWATILRDGEAALREPVSQAALVAGAWQGGKALHEQDDAVWSSMLTTNLETAYRSLRALLPGMVERKRGSIVLVGSRAAVSPETSAGAAAYATAKAGVVALMKATAAEVLEHGVRLNAILPSTMDTRANRRAMPKADFATWVSLESAAAVVAFLLSDEARDISGAAIPVYGRA